MKKVAHKKAAKGLKKSPAGAKTPKASTIRLKPELQSALDKISKHLDRPKNKIVNQAVAEYLEKTSLKLRDDIEDTLQNLQIYRQQDPNFEDTIERFVVAEASLAEKAPHKSTKTSETHSPTQVFPPSIQELIIDACREFEVNKLYLFGSLARDEAHEESDVDLLVEFKRKGVTGAFDQFMGFKERMESILNRPVDIITNKRFRNPYFQQAVEAEKQLIYAA
jgi:predicted nucleotidyltransferase/predicted transcriptional regulator